MADFTSTQTTIQSVAEATNVLNSLHSVYSQALTAQRLIQLYLSNADPVFNAAVNAMFSPVQRTELADMLTDVNTLIADWEANHQSALGITPEP
jgi:hypothetical protein